MTDMIAKVYPKGNATPYELYSIRKLTERECLRLMDLPEDCIDKLLSSPELGKSAIYKLAGNSIVCSCLKQIFEQMFFPKVQPLKLGIPKKINLVTLCSGYDSQAIALDQVCKEHNIEMELKAWSEFDPESNKPLDKQSPVIAHNLLFPQWSERNVGDMTKADWGKVSENWDEEIDVLTYSTPCQSISQVGKLEGMKEDSGTRSSIVFYTANAIKVLKPKFLIQENVKAILNKRNFEDFSQWQKRVEDLGYTNYYTVMNAKDYGIPQNRERMFMVSVRNDLIGEQLPGFTFPPKIPLKKTLLDDILEAKVDDKYYVSVEDICKYLESHDNVQSEDARYVVTNHLITTMEHSAIWECEFPQPKQYDIDRMFKQVLDTFFDSKNQPFEDGYIIQPFNYNVIKDGVSPTITTRPEGFKTSIFVVRKFGEWIKIS